MASIYDPAPVNAVTVTATVAVSQNDLVLWNTWFGVACNDAAVGDDLTLDISAGERICDTTSVSGVAASLGAPVYYDFTNKVYASASASGYCLVGYTTQILDSNDVFEYEKVRYTTAAS